MLTPVKTDPPLVSVVIPTFDRARSVTASIASADAQSYPVIEIVVVDDGSSDNTVEVVEGLQTRHPLKLIRLATNQGGGAARNAGIEASSGDYVAFLDSDDAWESSKIAKQIAALREAGEGYGACYTAVRYLDSTGRVIRIRPATKRGMIESDLMGLNWVGTTSSVLVERHCLDEAGHFDPAMRSCQDWELWIRLAQVTCFATVNEPLVSYSESDTGRITTDPRARLAGHLQVYRKHLKNVHRRCPAAKGRYCYVLGAILLQAGRRKLASRCFAAAWKARPTSCRRTGALVMALSGQSYETFSKVTEGAARVENRFLRAMGRVPTSVS
ncbi:MAG: glycosyltransferase family 2 protein [Alphaproteobacteria bacterium]|nr:glycosyltransferase family 2 protein [Alphaproteobacteria bacterium]